ncbi:hypothetical protein [Brevibacterium sp. VCM10]|uniref:hypothetical protein n=1 Tax=Brevibacterium sp. VCM10 TaxID=1381751 RepID=UPI0004B7C268|nr:hypothetical protein [Brevibacterium sp. VCM10]
MSTELTPLGRVIDAAQREHGWSLNQLGERAQKHGLKGLTKSNIGNLKMRAPLQISTAALKNLAILIQVPERVVVEAAIRSTNLEYPERNTTGAAEAIENDVEISARDKRILLAAITAMKEAGDGDEKATPHTDAGGTPVTGADDGLGAFGGRARGDLDHESINDGAGDNIRHLGERRQLSAERLAELEELQRRGDAATDDEIDSKAAYEPDESDKE